MWRLMNFHADYTAQQNKKNVMCFIWHSLTLTKEVPPNLNLAFVLLHHPQIFFIIYFIIEFPITYTDQQNTKKSIISIWHSMTITKFAPQNPNMVSVLLYHKQIF